MLRRVTYILLSLRDIQTSRARKPMIICITQDTREDTAMQSQTHALSDGTTLTNHRLRLQPRDSLIIIWQIAFVIMHVS